MGILRLRPEVMRREKLLNACAVLVPHFGNLRWNLPAVIKEIAAKGPRFLMRRISPEKRLIASEEDIGEMFSLRQRLLERYYTERRSGWSRLTHKARRFGSIGVRSLVEQSPDLSNRIVLVDELDRFGQRQVKVFCVGTSLICTASGAHRKFSVRNLPMPESAPSRRCLHPTKECHGCSVVRTILWARRECTMTHSMAWWTHIAGCMGCKTCSLPAVRFSQPVDLPIRR